jgi:hypothetical protein
MLGSLIQRVVWPLALAAALGLVLLVSSAEAAPGDPFKLGITNFIDQTTSLDGDGFGSQLVVVHENASSTEAAVQARSSAEQGYGVLATSPNIGVLGLSSGVRGVTSGGYGVVGGSTVGTGVWGRSLVGPGVFGDSVSSAGVVGSHIGPDGDAPGVEGDTASTASNAVGVLGQVTAAAAANSAAVRGINKGRGIGVDGISLTGGQGVFGSSNAPGGKGVFGVSAGGTGVEGQSPNWGVVGFSSSGIGVMGETATGAAAGFRGRVQIDGDLVVTAGHVKAFRIDDPLDPKHKYLVHAAVESNQVLNIYSGNITTDQHGTATVRLPAYFDRINTDVRYQLTVVGRFAQAIIAKKEARNRFVIRTDKPHVEVSWQVTARRNDSYLRAHPFRDIQKKTKADKDLTALLGRPAPKPPLP